jgi:large subunit ribosomal protein L13
MGLTFPLLGTTRRWLMATRSTPMNCAPLVEAQWQLIDCNDETVGRLATRIADVLRGKHRPTFTPNQDCGDFVVAINAEKVKFTGNKWDQKKYWSHSGFPGGIKGITAREMRDRHPEEILRKAVKGMLPKNRLSSQLIKKLKIYAGSEHPHSAQQPKAVA